MTGAGRAARLLLVQPWLGAPGHPAQSLLHMARALGTHHCITFLVPHVTSASEVYRELGSHGSLAIYRTPSGFPASTVAAVLRARVLARANPYEVVFFCDAHLPCLLALAALGRLDLPRPAAVMLQGPERTMQSALRRILLQRALRHSSLDLYCRTEELTLAWRDAIGVHAQRVSTLPSLELSRIEFVDPAPHSGPLRLGILGQVRAGKGIERVTSACSAMRDVALTIAGPYASRAARRRFQPLLAAIDSESRVLSESELIAVASRQDYVLLLYDDWDDRMESGVFYLAAAVGRPVVVYAGGWSARQVEQYQCGVILPRDSALEVLATLPRTGQAYHQQCAGMRRFAIEHHSGKLADRFVADITSHSTRFPGK